DRRAPCSARRPRARVRRPRALRRSATRQTGTRRAGCRAGGGRTRNARLGRHRRNARGCCAVIADSPYAVLGSPHGRILLDALAEFDETHAAAAAQRARTLAPPNVAAAAL